MDIKHNKLCKHFAFFMNCANQLEMEYCPFIHNIDCRQAYSLQEEYLEKGL